MCQAHELYGVMTAPTRRPPESAIELHYPLESTPRPSSDSEPRVVRKGSHARPSSVTTALAFGLAAMPAATIATACVYLSSETKYLGGSARPPPPARPE